MNDSELADESKGEATPNPGTTSASQTLGLSALDPSFPLSELLRSGGISTHHEMASSIHKQFQSPFSWPLRRKAAVLTSPFFAAMLAAYSAGAYAMAAPPLQQRWQVTPTEFNIGITIFVAGFGFAPMTLAPVSEAYGRYWVFVGSGVVFFLGTLGCALTNSYAGMLVSRLVTGSGASVFATLTGGVVGDVFRKEDRNTPMALYSLAILVGTGLGPLISGITVDRLGWRWIFYLQLVFIGSTTLAILLTFTETRSNVLLQRKCAALNSCMERRGYSLRFQSQFAEEGFDLNIIWKSFAFPMRLLITEPVVFCFSMWASFAWAILYMQFNSIGIVFRDVYGFDSTRVGAVFTAVIVASILSTCLAICQNHVLLRLWPHRMATPEGRLLSPSLQSILLPIGLFWFGWTARANVSWVSPALAIASCTMGIFSIYLAVFNYLADTYGPFGSSAQAAQSMCRNLLAGIFPLVTHIMLRNLTYAGAGSLLGGLGLVLTAIPWALSFYGHQIRARSLFAKTVIEMHH
ncbi:major facilitator superfamily protein [Stachybotrys elegans]|uniref:Major facilitator superfamily protein n=1 Tax=Stachybotrys elegans TaxID=80388 RepID=A0A8K0SG43_9HYPO|nr:major facilitator superfamily protein [Stachybotrys elegans]